MKEKQYINNKIRSYLMMLLGLITIFVIGSIFFRVDDTKNGDVDIPLNYNEIYLTELLNEHDVFNSLVENRKIEFDYKLAISKTHEGYDINIIESTFIEERENLIILLDQYVLLSNEQGENSDYTQNHINLIQEKVDYILFLEEQMIRYGGEGYGRLE